jgi:membrane protein
LPITLDLIINNLREVLDARGAVGLISLLTFLWSASAFFTNLAYNINLAWPDAPRRSFLRRRLVGLGMIMGLLGLLILSLVLDWITGLIPILNIENGSPPNLILWTLLSNLGSWLTIFLLFLALYRWAPVANVHWTANFWGALTSSILWRIATAGFGWYLQSGLGRYQLVYGSLGAIVAFLFLIYILSIIMLFGAHLSSAIDRWESENRTKKGAT